MAEPIKAPVKAPIVAEPVVTQMVFEEPPKIEKTSDSVPLTIADKQPCNWNILSCIEGVITANNISTMRNFVGTKEEFRKLFKAE